MFLEVKMLNILSVLYNIFVKCKWVDTQWQ